MTAKEVRISDLENLMENYKRTMKMIFDNHERKTKGMLAPEANKVWNTEYKKFYDRIFNKAKVAAKEYYELKFN